MNGLTIVIVTSFEITIKGQCLLKISDAKKNRYNKTINSIAAINIIILYCTNNSIQLINSNEVAMKKLST